MNVIFLDFEGVLTTYHFSSDEDVERRIKTLSDICHEYNAKIVIEAAGKDAIDEETMEINNDWVEFVFDCFKKYDIECIGRTPNFKKNNIDMWKEDEIILYLLNHPEIEHYCVIDDDDAKNIFHWNPSDLEKVRDHLVETKIYDNDDINEEGLLPRHKEEVGRILVKENEIRNLFYKRKTEEETQGQMKRILSNGQ